MQNNFKKLTTEATNTEYNWNNYPRPNLKRESFFPLNDFWDLSVLKGNKITHLGNILVPFPPESNLSGIARPLKKGEKYLYKKTFTLPKNFCKEKVNKQKKKVFLKYLQH